MPAPEIAEELKALKKWKQGGRGEAMMSSFVEYRHSHDQMFIEGYRAAKAKYNKEPQEFVQYEQTPDSKE